MQLLCLAHGAYLAPESANQIALFLDCDTRRAFACLHFWTSWLHGNHLVGTEDEQASNKVKKENSLVDSQPETCPRTFERSPDARCRATPPLLSVEQLCGLSSYHRRQLEHVQLVPPITMTTPSHHVHLPTLVEAVRLLHASGGFHLTPGLERWVGLVRERRDNSGEFSCDCLASTEGEEGREGGEIAVMADVEVCIADVRATPLSPVNKNTKIHLHNSTHSHAQLPSSSSHTLRALTTFYDACSHSDVMATASHDSHVTCHIDCHTPWWKCHAYTDLVDDPQVVVGGGGGEGVGEEVRAAMAGLSALQCGREMAGPVVAAPVAGEGLEEEGAGYGLAARAELWRSV